MGKGFTDEAAQKDVFEIGKYIDGLTVFIESCNTPMTISVQGEWGTGKTSIMQMINGRLEEREKTKNIWFNTWQYTQFDMGDELTLSLLSCLLEELTLSEEQRENVAMTTKAIKFAKTAGRIAKEVTLTLVDSTVGGKAADNIEKGMDRLQGLGEEEVSPAKAIKHLKEQFTQCVQDTLAKTGRERLVVFIDDLDRLEPRKAVELLEILKLFLDCKNCVFVIAIDYEVVCKGVASKYGNDMSEEKGKSFFDKIIQLSFKMPINEYNISNYVMDCFKQIGIPCPLTEADTYVNLIKSSIGTNPRSMKRLFNAYLLLTIVISEEILASDKNKQLLFAVLCMQNSFEKLYAYIVQHRKTITVDDLIVISEGEYQDINQKFNGIKLEETNVARVQVFMEQFLQVMGVNNDGTDNGKEIENLRNVLNVSTITSVNDDTVTVRKNTEVKTIEELNLGGKNPEELQLLIDTVKGIAADITCSMRNNKTVTVVFKNQRGITFTEIYVQKNGYSVYCSGQSEQIFTGATVKEILEEKNIAVKAQKNYAYVKLHIANPSESKDDLRVLAGVCYDSYKEQ